jgi:TolA-binding protein
MDRQHRHDLKHDKFVDEIGALSSRAKANQRVLLLIGVATIAVALLAYGFFFWRSNKEGKAQLALATAIETIEAPVGEEQQPDQPPTPGPKFKTADERNAAAEKQFREVQSKFGGTDAADLASLYLARLSVLKGDSTTARKGLEEFIDDHGDHPLLGASARYSLYQLRIENGEAAQVATELDAELKKAEPALPGDALLILLAQAYDVQGNAAKSRETYRRITTDFPDSQYAVEAARRAGTA